MADLLNTHRAMLERWRRKMNLVGPGDPEEHFQDCLSGLAGLTPVGRWADLGSGAGLPGLVFAHLFPQIQLDLVDSRRKRCTFLELVLAEAQVDPTRVQVRCQRVETLEEGLYDGVMARAFAKPPAVVDYARRLLKPGGTIALFQQEGAEVVPGTSVFHVEHYVVRGKARKVVMMRLDEG